MISIKKPSLLLVVFTFCTTLSGYGQTLNLGMAASAEVLGADEYSTITVVVSNTGTAEAKNIVVAINLPNDIHTFRHSELPDFDCPGTNCEANEVATWTVGSLMPGESQSILFKIHISGNTTATALNSSAVASSSNASSVSASLAFIIDQTPLLRLGLSSNGPVKSGQELIYTIHVGNSGSISPSNVLLTMPVPAGASFSHASHGGTLSSGTVSWNIGFLGSEEGRLVELAVMTNSSLVDGDLITAFAELDPGLSTEETMRASVLDPIISNSPLHLHYGISETAVAPGADITYTLTATNTGTTTLNNTEGIIMLPAFIQNFRKSEIPGFDCPGTDCGAGEIATWSIGSLSPGQSATVNFRTIAHGNAPVGQIIRTTARLSADSASTVMVAQNVQLDPTPLLRLGLSSDPAPLLPGVPLTYTLTFGNLASASSTNAILEMPVPYGTTFNSASHGGVLSNGVVSWAIPAFAPGEGDRVHVTVTPDASLTEGEVIPAHADITSNVASEYVIRSTSALPVHSSPSLVLKYEAAPGAVSPGSAVVYTVTAINKGTVNLINVSAQVLLPHHIDNFAYTTLADFDCPGTDCGADEIATWNIGTLAPNQSKTISFSSTVRGNTDPGQVLNSRVAASASNSGTSMAQGGTDVLVGSLLNISIKEQGFMDDDLVLSNYPNPFKGTTTFTIDLPYAAKAELKVYDSRGQEVATVMHENLPAGKSSYNWNAGELAIGIYYYRLESESFSKTGKLIIQ